MPWKCLFVLLLAGNFFFLCLIKLQTNIVLDKSYSLLHYETTKPFKNNYKS